MMLGAFSTLYKIHFAADIDEMPANELLILEKEVR